MEELHFFDSCKSIIENAYFFSGVLLALFGLVGVYQVILTKRLFKISSDRDAKILALKQIDYFNDTLIREIDNLADTCKEQGVDNVNIKQGDFSKDYIKEKLSNQEIEEIIEKRSVIHRQFLLLFNHIEAFSTYFVNEAANESIAYSSIGRTFCHTVEKYYFDIAFGNSKKDNTLFKNTRELYQKWHKKIQKEDLTYDIQELSKERDSLN